MSATGVAADTEATAGERVAASCGGESFSPDTEVVMGDGTTKPLDRVEFGDKVRATDIKTGKTPARGVTGVWVNHDTDLMNVTVQTDGKTTVVHATQHHLFWVPAKRAWVEADYLAAGEALLTDNGATATVAGTVIVPGAADMWDLTVENDHDFYVVTTITNVLVHNCFVKGGTIPSANELTFNPDATGPHTSSDSTKMVK